MSAPRLLIVGVQYLAGEITLQMADMTKEVPQDIEAGQEVYLQPIQPQDPTCTEPDRKNCPRLCIDFCNKAEEVAVASQPCMVPIPPDMRWPADLGEPSDTDSVKHLAQGLIKYAAKRGLVVTIERRPLQPLAMGYGESVVEVWDKRSPS